MIAIPPALVLAHPRATAEQVSAIARLAIREGYLPVVVHQSNPWYDGPTAAAHVAEAARLVARLHSGARLWMLDEHDDDDRRAQSWSAEVLRRWGYEAGRSTVRVRRGTWVWWSRAIPRDYGAPEAR